MDSCPVLVVEKRPLLREGLTCLITSSTFYVVAKLASVDELSPGVLPHSGPLLLVLGSSQEPAATAREITIFKQWYPFARVAVLAESHNPAEVVMSFRAGADAYLANVACLKALIKSLELVINGERLLMSGMLSMHFDPQHEHINTDDQAGWSADLEDVERSEPKSEGDLTPRLSFRERAILGYLVAGASNKVIARRIGMAESTVKVHVKSIMRKIRVLNRTQAAIWATQNHHALELPYERPTHAQ